ncbi:MAG: hypothetical protein IPG07_19070 [Crocinitomicaceae bacterium]|nr:hypothetical protein [Crocinitomicaceae bacterium]
MRSKFLSVFMLLFLSIRISAQTTINGTVVAIIPMGNQSFSILNETGTENYFKTSPHPLGELQLQASIQIELHPNDKIGRVISPTLSEPLFCRRIQPNTPLDQLVAVLQYMPQEENDILFFEDTTHIRLFYDEIVELYEMTNKELDVILNAVEAQAKDFSEC